MGVNPVGGIGSYAGSVDTEPTQQFGGWNFKVPNIADFATI